MCMKLFSLFKRIFKKKKSEEKPNLGQTAEPKKNRERISVPKEHFEEVSRMLAFITENGVFSGTNKWRVAEDFWFVVKKHKVLSENKLGELCATNNNRSTYKFPTIDLLRQYPDWKVDEKLVRNLISEKDKLLQIFSDYGIQIVNVTLTVGIAGTFYELVPAPGFRFSKMKYLGNDILFSFSVWGTRIISPIPTKSVIGVEVPNNMEQINPLRSLIASRKFQVTKSHLPVALGYTITNDHFMFDLTRMPHLLVSGTSVRCKNLLNLLITSLLYKKSPSQLKFVLIDPSRIEFAVYAKIERQFLAKLPDEDSAIVTDARKALKTLEALKKEMDLRFALLKSARVMHVDDYNEKFLDQRLDPAQGHRYMPYIVVVVDSFEDLILTVGGEMESVLADIAQLAHRVGIHLVVATHSRKLNLTDRFKTYFHVRMTFKDSDLLEIYDVLETNRMMDFGELLNQRGLDTIRVQCAFVDTSEVVAVTEFISNQQEDSEVFLLPKVDD